VAEVRSPFRAVRLAVALHYAHHEVVTAEQFADFHISVKPPVSIRRWLKPQALFQFDHRCPFNPLPAEQALPLLEWGLNWCVSAHSHQYLTVHAAVVERRGRALILPAPPGSGKSTLCAALVARGFRLLSDELALVDIRNGMIFPIPRPISLKNQSIRLIARFWPNAAMSATVQNTLKGSVTHVQPPRESVEMGKQAALPGWVVLPTYRADHPTSMRGVSKAAAFMRLVDCAFNYAIHGRRGFETVAQLASVSRCYEFTYGGDLDEAVRAFEALTLVA
jgi:HprK-related kinase A